jgi:Zn-finger nucleic acid-binding protein
MDCPRCRTVLVGTEYEGVLVEKCPQCRGFWIPGYRLSEIIEKRERTFSLEEIEAYRQVHESRAGLVHPADSEICCPDCGVSMLRSHYHYAQEVLIDRCPQGHGVWLDEGELEHIQMAVEEDEDELRQVVKEKGLRVDDTVSQQLEQERKKYKFSPLWLFLWKWGHGGG